MSQVGRISGPLLFANLERNGIDLAFRNNLDTTPLLFLDVNNNKVSVNTNTPIRDFTVEGTSKTVNLITGDTEIANFSLSDGDITGLGDVSLSAANIIELSILDNGTIRIQDNNISTTTSNSDLDFRPNGTGSVDVYNNLSTYGNIYSTGDVTLEGTITFGDADTDTISIPAEVNSDLEPNATNSYSLGSSTKQWLNFYVNLVNGEAITVGSASVAGIDYNLTQGNIFYVALNGNDSNKGDHLFAPFATIGKALQAADASIQGPVTIYVYPGEYEESLPLTVPSNVTVKGVDFRNVIVKPDTSTQSEDVFLMNGESTVENLTVKDFYYDSINDKGYAFRFAPNTVVSTRSPYVKNVSVITKGTTVTADDPRGFASGDAGKGALVDGSDVLSASQEASMLFHSVTFITPGVDALTMTNGVRVEWLNSFSYFANRGLYAVDGVTGHLSSDGSTVKYGAEIRSIGSANVYGNYGAVADGADCLMYLIQHNFGYIGAGKFVDNDPSRAIQANETLEQNSGTIYFQTQDHTGSFRVGENFFVDFETGGTTINLDALTADSFSGLRVTTGGDTTVVRGDYIDVGNFRLRDNTIETIVGDINVSSAGEINLLTDTNVSNDLDITGNLSFSGNLNLLGNEATDTLDFNVDFDQDFNPHISLAHTLGSVTKYWLSANSSQSQINDIQIKDNFITTTISNANLELRSNGTGLINIDSNDVNITNNLTIDSTTNFLSTNITGNNTYTGNIAVENPLGPITDNATLIGTNGVRGSNNFYVEFRGGGSPGVDEYFAEVATFARYVYIGDDLSAQVGDYVMVTFDNGARTIIRLGEPYSPGPGYPTNMTPFELAEYIYLDSAGEIYRPLGPFAPFPAILYQGKTAQVLVSSSLGTGADFNTTNLTITQDLDISSQAQFEEILFAGNVIQTTTSNADLELRANNTGKIVIDSSVDISQNLVAGNTTIQGTTDIDNTVSFGQADIDSITIRDNYITTNDSDADLELRAAGLGQLDIVSDFIADEDLTVQKNVSLQNIIIDGTVTQTGDLEIGPADYILTGNLTSTKQLSIAADAQLENILISGNVLQTTQSNSDIELRASGTGQVILQDNVQVNNNLNARVITANNINVNTDIVLNEIVIPPSIIEIDDNFISTKISNADLDLRANGTGQILVPNDNVIVDNSATINGTTSFSTTNTGNITQNGNTSITGLGELTGSITADFVNFQAQSQFEDIQISGNTISTVDTNSDLELRASGTGNVVFPELLISQDMLSSSLTVPVINIDGQFSLEELESSSDIQIFDNVITTTNSNSNLELKTNGTGNVDLLDVTFNNNALSTKMNDLVFASTTNILDLSNNTTLNVPVGGDLDRPLVPEKADFRYNQTAGLFEGYGTAWEYLGGVFSTDRQTSVTAHPTNNTISLKVAGTVVGTVGQTGISIHGLQVDDILIDVNSISTNVSNSDLELQRAGTGEVVIDDTSLATSVIKNNATTDTLVLQNTGFGYVKFSVDNGVVIPVGTNADVPTNTETGDLRWNTDEQYLEVWDGNTYVVSVGTSAAISQSDYEDLLLEYTLILG